MKFGFVIFALFMLLAILGGCGQGCLPFQNGSGAQGNSASVPICNT